MPPRLVFPTTLPLRRSLVSRHYPNALQTRCVSFSRLDEDKGGRERVIVLGCGWAGYGFARTLDPRFYQPVMISPRTYFVFTPLLAGTAVGTLEFRNAIESAHRIRGTEVIRGWANEVDLNRKTLLVRTALEKKGPRDEETKLIGGDEFEIGWDKLVIAVGAFNQTFGIEGVTENAFFLKDSGDARKIRRRLLECFEAAHLPTMSEEKKSQLLNFAIVGGGPTGVEFAGELHDLISEDLSRAYPGLTQYVNITVYDVAPRILSNFDTELGKYAERVFAREGITIATNHHVTKVDKDAIYTKEDGRIPVGMVVWSTGLKGNPFLREAFKVPFKDGDGKKWKVVPGKGTLAVDGHHRLLLTDASAKDPNSAERKALDHVFALGDCASLPNPLPATAQVANQQAQYLGRTLNRMAKRNVAIDQLPEFKFRDLGIMAYLGGWRAIMQSGKGTHEKRRWGIDLKGRAAWLLWRTAYLTKSVSVRNKVLILVMWFTNWLLGRDINRF